MDGSAPFEPGPSLALYCHPAPERRLPGYWRTKSVRFIQKFLGHKNFNTTMIYARAHDQIVEADYFAAMERVEQRLDLAPVAEADGEPLQAGEHAQLMALVERLAEPPLEPAIRLNLVILMRALREAQNRRRHRWRR